MTHIIQRQRNGNTALQDILEWNNARYGCETFIYSTAGLFTCVRLIFTVKCKGALSQIK